MSRLRLLLTSFVLVGLITLLVGTTAAAPRQKPSPPKRGPQKTRITWTPKRVVQTLNPGQTVQVNVTLTSSTDLHNLQLQLPGRLGKTAKVSPSQIATVKASVPTSVTLTLTMPNGETDGVGGVVLVKAPKARTLPGNLSVKLKAPEPEPEASPEPSPEN